MMCGGNTPGVFRNRPLFMKTPVHFCEENRWFFAFWVGDGNRMRGLTHAEVRG